MCRGLRTSPTYIHRWCVRDNPLPLISKNEAARRRIALERRESEKRDSIFRKIKNRSERRRTRQRGIQMGNESRIYGLQFEKLISRSCDWYRKQGLADLEKTPEPMRPVRKLKDGKYVAVYAEKAQVDYKGVMAGGRAVAFEAKFCTGEKITKSRVKDWQMQQLLNYEKLGAKCFVLVGWNSFAAAVPVHEWRTLKKEETERWKVKINSENVLEFLGGVSDFAG